MGSSTAEAPGPEVRITDRDRELLEFVAEHRLVRTDHAARLLGVAGPSAAERLRRLGRHGFVRRVPGFDGHPACHLITRAGLGLIGSGLPVPRAKLAAYDHDVGLAWLWLAARGGAFGTLRSVIAERTMRSLDGPDRRAHPPLAVRLGGVGAGGLERVHYPDLLLVTARGARVAVELELTGKARTRREAILAGYGADPSIDAVLYLVQNRAVGTAILHSARRLGISSLVRVQRVAIAGITGGDRRAGAERRPHRVPTRPPGLSFERQGAGR
jgi:hypothetical protein